MNTFKVLRELAALKQNEKKSAPQLHQLQQEQLRRMLTYAYEHSLYYKSAFEAAGLTAETVKTAPLSAFPSLDKAALLERFDDHQERNKSEVSLVIWYDKEKYF